MAQNMQFISTSREAGVEFIYQSQPEHGEDLSALDVGRALDVNYTSLLQHSSAQPCDNTRKITPRLRRSGQSIEPSSFENQPQVLGFAANTHSHVRTGPNELVSSHQESTSEPHIPLTRSTSVVISTTDFDRDLTTRNLCIIALIIAWHVSFASLALGIYIIVTGPIQVPSYLVDRYVAVGTIAYSWVAPPEPGLPNPYLADHRVYRVPEAAMYTISLFLTIALTALLDSINFIHSTSLRWALWHEGKPICNSNARLFTCSKHHYPTGLLANIFSGIGLVVTYGGMSILTFNVYIIAKLIVTGNHADFDKNVPGARYGIDFNAWGLIGVGSGVFLQAVISTLCLVSGRRRIATWCSNPLANAKACSLAPQTYKDTTASIPNTEGVSRTDISTSHSNNTLFNHQMQDSRSGYGLDTPIRHVPQIPLSRPRRKQQSISSVIQYTRKLAALVWIFFATHCAFVIIIGILGKRYESASLHFVEQAGGRLDFLAYLQNFGLVRIRYNDDPYSTSREWLSLIVQSIVLSAVIFNLHLVEFITLLVRDEKIWRKATTRAGLTLKSGAFVQGASIWPCWVLLIFKSVVPWIFSYGFSCNYNIAMSLIPLLVLVVVYLLIALFVEGMLRWEPKGSQPSTYGNIPALLSLVDEWPHEKLFWGHKHVFTDKIGKAGVAGSRLADVQDDMLYKGLHANFKF